MSDKQPSGGVGFLGFLCLLFIGLKLGNVINWSWFWVLSPLWIPMLACGLVFVLVGIIYGAVVTIEAFQERRSRQ